MVGIYRITNTVNGKCYVGQSINIEKRLRQHKSMLFSGTHYNAHLQSAVSRYGIDKFEFIPIEECLESELNSKERHWIAKCNSLNEGYNKTSGGENEDGWRHSESTKEKIAKKLSGDNNPMKNPKVSYRANTLREWKESSRKALSDRLSGATWMNDGTKECQIPPDKVSYYKSLGWKLGRCFNQSGSLNPMYGKRGKHSPHYGTIAMTDGNHTVYVTSDKVYSYESLGFHRGRDNSCCESISISKSFRILFDGQLFYGSYRLKDYLREHGYPKISPTTVMRLAKGEHVKGYSSLYGRLSLEKNGGD